MDLFAPFIEKATGVKRGGFPEGGGHVSDEDAPTLAELVAGVPEEGAEAISPEKAKQILAEGARILGLNAGASDPDEELEPEPVKSGRDGGES